MTWTCLIDAFACATGVSSDEIIRRIGHDGSEKVFDFPEPYCRRSFHIQEIFDALFPDFVFMEIELQPRIAGGPYGTALKVFENEDERFMHYIDNFPTILIGRHKDKPDSRHAVCYKEGKIHDYNQNTYPLQKFVVWTSYICIRRNDKTSERKT